MQILEKLFYNRFSKPTLQIQRYKKDSACLPFLLPDFKAEVVVASYDYSRVAALASTIGLLSKGEISFIGLFDSPKLGTVNVWDPGIGGETFYQQAYLTARHYAHYTGKPCLAESHGLVVYALRGAPGVRSRHYDFPNSLGYVNCADRVLIDLRGKRDRRCAYCVSICLAHPRKYEVLHWQGHLKGEIGFKREGRGPIYQDILRLRGLGKTLGALTGEEKSRYSFWSRCVADLRADYPRIRELLDLAPLAGGGGGPGGP
jgi:XTP/dITP diphosphohydrolase